jgi:hypothetical protein
MNRKEQLLSDAGYRYNFDRLAYVNRDAKKIFAVDDIADHSEEWLASKIAEPNPSGDWRFYEEPSTGIRRALVAELNGQPAHR